MRALAATFLLLALITGSASLVQAAFPPITILSVRSPVPRGGMGFVAVRTSPNTPCSITVFYRSGPSRATGLEAKTSDGQGRVSWTWKVGTRTTPGTWPIRIECGSDELTRVETEFRVI